MKAFREASKGDEERVGRGDDDAWEDIEEVEEGREERARGMKAVMLARRREGNQGQDADVRFSRHFYTGSHGTGKIRRTQLCRPALQPSLLFERSSQQR
jgi:hypothetical protein